MPGSRAVVVTVPPLLADLIRHVLTSRAGLPIVAELVDADSAYAHLRALPSGGPRPVDPALVRALLPAARVLALSPDLTQLLGPGAQDSAAFTPDTLAARLLP